MKVLLVATTVIEAGAGLALVLIPSIAATFLLGSPLDTPVTLIVGRVAGVALFTLGIACGFGSRDAESCAARGLVTAMLFYNAAVAALLAFAGIGLGLHAVALWPAVILHVVMTAWCVFVFRLGQGK